MGADVLGLNGKASGRCDVSQWRVLSVLELIPARFMAVDAVCLELVSAMNYLVSGNFAGKQPSRTRRTAANNAENLRVS